MKSLRLAAAVVVAAALPCAWLAADEDATLVNPAAPPGSAGEEIPVPSGVVDGAVGAKGWKYVGTASCTAANCHGGDGTRLVRPGGDPISPQAYSKWIQNDPHASAFTVLYNEQSQLIAKRLDLGDAHMAQVCLACHSINPPHDRLAVAARHTPHDGVGCEACHGAAEKWLDAHKWASWDSLSAGQKEALGFRDLTDLTVRARVCTDCHVGSPGRDVNHDLIAAGHPRMSFEMSAYHANLPKHWTTERTPADELDARLWLIGQATTAQSALALLAHRAGDAKSPWPEFSEYDCFACHHDLADPSWRQAGYGSVAGQLLGAAPWGSWNYAFLKLIRSDQTPVDDAPLDRLRAAMQQAIPDRQAVGQLAEQAMGEADEAAQWAADQPLGPAERAAWLRRLAAAPAATGLDSWDAAAQRFLGCAALNYAEWMAAKKAGGSTPPSIGQVAGALERIRDALQFGDANDPVRYDSPKSHADKRGAVSAAFQEIQRAAAAAPAP